jgi:hypothetical protein
LNSRPLENIAQESPNASPFESRLTNGTDRFIAHLIEHAFVIGRRTSRDFLRHFSPATIMDALKDQPTLRADILEAATGVRRKVAIKKSATSSGEDLQIALDEGEAAPDEIVRLFRPDDRVRYLPRGKLWSFVIEGEFWNANKTDKSSYDRATQHVAFLLDRALKDQLISHQDIVDGISIAKISQLMPRPELEMALTSALAAGRKGQPFSDRDFYDTLSSTTITAHIPLPHLWDEVVHPCIAVEHGLVNVPNGPAKAQDEAQSGLEGPKPQPANSNDASAQSKAPQARVLVPASAIKRPRPNDAPAMAPASASKPAATANKFPSAASELAAQEEVPCDIDLDDTLTASRG